MAYAIAAAGQRIWLIHKGQQTKSPGVAAPRLFCSGFGAKRAWLCPNLGLTHRKSCGIIGHHRKTQGREEYAINNVPESFERWEEARRLWRKMVSEQRSRLPTQGQAAMGAPITALGYRILSCTCRGLRREAQTNKGGITKHSSFRPLKRDGGFFRVGTANHVASPMSTTARTERKTDYGKRKRNHPH